jgi:chaperonin GroEL (HSP60 family)
VHPVLGPKLQISILISSSIQTPFIIIDGKMRNNFLLFSLSLQWSEHNYAAQVTKTTENVSLRDGSTGLLILNTLLK